MKDQLIQALESYQSAFGLDLSPETCESLATYNAFVLEHNDILHLVAPCEPSEFAVRHLLESMFILKHLPHGSSFADVGSGAGLPGLPCLIGRSDLKGILIESKVRKSRFLEMAAEHCGVEERSQVINRQFEEVTVPDVFAVTARALDKFPRKAARLVKWAQGKPLLLYSGPGLESAFEESGIAFEKELIPLSEQRYLYRLPGGQ